MAGPNPWAVRVQAHRAALYINTVRAELPKRVRRVMKAAYSRALERLIRATPKRFTGKTRKAWRVVETPKGFVLRNDTDVMVFLERGTRSHGPVRAKFLYIPLTYKASKGWNRSLKYGTDYVLAKRVRGIRAMRIIAKETEALRKELAKDLGKLYRKLGPL